MARRNYLTELSLATAEAYARQLRQWWHETGDYHEKMRALAQALLSDHEKYLLFEAFKGTFFTNDWFSQLAIDPENVLKDQSPGVMIETAGLLVAFVQSERAKEKANAEAD